jgi:hypothetical protein
MKGRNQRIKSFYAGLWDVDVQDNDLKPTDVFRATGTVQANHISDFVHVIDNQSEIYHSEKPVAPMDFGIVVGWKSLVTALLPKEIDGDLLRLVHLSNQFTTLSDDVIMADDQVDTEAIVNSVTIGSLGKVTFSEIIFCTETIDIYYGNILDC